MFIYNELIFSCLPCLIFPGQLRGSTGGNSSGDGAVPQPAFGHGKVALQKGNPAEPAHQHQRGAVPGLQCKTLHSKFQKQKQQNNLTRWLSVFLFQKNTVCLCSYRTNLVLLWPLFLSFIVQLGKFHIRGLCKSQTKILKKREDDMQQKAAGWDETKATVMSTTVSVHGAHALF